MRERWRHLVFRTRPCQEPMLRLELPGKRRRCYWAGRGISVWWGRTTETSIKRVLCKKNPQDLQAGNHQQQKAPAKNKAGGRRDRRRRGWICLPMRKPASPVRPCPGNPRGREKEEDQGTDRDRNWRLLTWTWRELETDRRRWWGVLGGWCPTRKTGSHLHKVTFSKVWK